MEPTGREHYVTRLLEAWNAQDVEGVLACYTEDVRYLDPNTRGEVVGRPALRRYLTKLFSTWRMTWTRRAMFDLSAEGGRAA